MDINKNFDFYEWWYKKMDNESTYCAIFSKLTKGKHVPIVTIIKNVYPNFCEDAITCTYDSFGRTDLVDDDYIKKVIRMTDPKGECDHISLHHAFAITQEEKELIEKFKKEMDDITFVTSPNGNYVYEWSPEDPSLTIDYNINSCGEIAMKIWLGQGVDKPFEEIK